MSQATLIFPHQLYPDYLYPSHQVHLLEDSLFFGDATYPAQFHKQKLVLHRASLKALEQRLRQTDYQIHYHEYQSNLLTRVLKDLRDQQVTTVHVVDPTDYILSRRLKRYCQRLSLKLHIHPSPNFLTSLNQIELFYKDKKRFHQTDFYIWQRQRLQLLIDKDSQPLGGNWTYDTENRRKLPQDIQLPRPLLLKYDQTLEEAIAYVEANFPDNPGSVEGFNYPITPEQTQQVFTHFLKSGLAQFGPYQDAMTNRSDTVFHSVLTPGLNLGLISPQDIIDQTLEWSNKHSLPLPSLEGFIRQIIGWREFMRAMYHIQGTQMRTTNYFGFSRRLNQAWYQGQLGIPPVDEAIRKLNRTAYAHHIERLMILGNFMLLCEIDPDEVYRWFMELTIDSYDWVMVPNVYGMSQFADGGTIVTKPYISSSNYIRKMSDYTSSDWCDIWDGLYWRFLDRHRSKFANNPRMRLMLNLLNKMDRVKLGQHQKTAETFLESLT